MTRAVLAPERWRRVEELFHASIDLPTDQREGFLREACGQDNQLRAEVESLLANDFKESPVIAGIVDEAAARLLGDDEEA